MNRYLLEDGTVENGWAINVSGVKLPKYVYVVKEFKHEINAVICKAKTVRKNGCIYLETDHDLSGYDLLLSWHSGDEIKLNGFTFVKSCVMKSVGAFPAGTYYKIK